MLTEREVIRLHQLSKDGKRPSEIANILVCHPQTVYEHLGFRIAYSNRIYQKIGKTPTFPNANELTIYQAATYLPGWPSKDKTFRLYKHGILRSCRGARKRVSLTTTLEMVAEAAKKMISGTGIFISASLLSAISQEACWNIRASGQKLNYWPSRQMYYPFVLANQEVEALGKSIETPACVVYRISRVLEVCGVVTI